MFINRQEAGKLLAKKITEYKGAIILGITRGGVIVAAEIASYLNLPVYPIIVKKIGAWGNKELAIGALTLDNTIYLDKELIKTTGTTKEYIKSEIKDKQQEIKELLNRFNLSKQLPLAKKTVILVDDGVATGATIKVVLKYLRKKKSGKIIVAVPVIAQDSYQQLKRQVDEIIALEIPEYFGAVGEFYRDFPQVSDEEVIKFIKALKH